MNKRAKIYEHYIPRTTTNMIVFSYNALQNKFDKTRYNPMLTNYRLKEDQLSEFLEGLEKQIQLYNNNDGRETMFKFLWLLFLLIIVVSIVSGLHAIKVIDDDSFFKAALPVILTFLMLILLIFLAFLVRFLIKSRNLMRNVANQAKAYVQEKGAVFREKGLFWSIPVYYPTWIELWKDMLPPSESGGTVFSGGNTLHTSTTIIITPQRNISVHLPGQNQPKALDQQSSRILRVKTVNENDDSSKMTPNDSPVKSPENITSSRLLIRLQEVPS